MHGHTTIQMYFILKENGETFLELDVDNIKNNPMQPRLHIDEAELKDLTRSIKLHGLIQPIAVIKVGDDEYILKAGQRRWLAHKDHLAASSLEILEGSREDMIETLLTLGGSSAGARPKAVIQLDTENQKIIHGAQALRDGYNQKQY